MALNTTKVLSTIPKCKKAVVCLTEKLCMLDKFHSGLCYSAVGHAFKVSKSKIYIKQNAFKQKQP